MVMSEQEFLRNLRQIFRTEAEEHLKAITAGMIGFEHACEGERLAPLETALRETHSLKGAARAVNEGGIERICQELEDVLVALKHGRLAPSPPLADCIHATLDLLEALAVREQPPPGAGAESIVGNLRSWLAPGLRSLAPQSSASGVPAPASLEAHGAPGTGSVPAGKPDPAHAGVRIAESETIRVSKAKLDSLMVQAEEMLSIKLTARQRIEDLQGICSSLSDLARDVDRALPAARAKRQQIESGANGASNGNRGRAGAANAGLIKVFDCLERTCTALQALERAYGDILASSHRDLHATNAMVDKLLDDSKSVLMFPFSSFLDQFPKIVRDLARDQGKQADLSVSGGEVEIDRRILDEMKAPLIHLVRNAMDHGIEPPALRESLAKPARGRLRIDVSQTGSGAIEIAVSDDGAGIDVNAVAQSAVASGVVSQTEAEALSREERMMLIFESGLSTKDAVTSISGRGLGLAIVRDKILKLGGTFRVKSEPGAGTSFRIALPLTLATFRGVLVRTRGEVFVAPTSSIRRAMRCPADAIEKAGGRDTIIVQGQPVPVVRLDEVLRLAARTNGNGNGTAAPEHIQVLIVGSGKSVLGLAVDEILGEQEILVKKLGKQIRRIPLLFGAAVLGSGKVAPVLNVQDIADAVVRRGRDIAADAAEETSAGPQTRTIVVADDSITSRSLLRNILESAGYVVHAAADGSEAFRILKTEQIDLLVSDVEMPKLNGFELTSKIRADKDLARLPVVLVTGLASRADQERGIEAGANAYVIKSSFDQTNLVEIVRKLL